MNEKEESQRCPSKDGPPISTGPEVMGLPGIAACLDRLSAQHLGRRPQGQDAAVHKMANSGPRSKRVGESRVTENHTYNDCNEKFTWAADGARIIEPTEALSLSRILLCHGSVDSNSR